MLFLSVLCLFTGSTVLYDYSIKDGFLNYETKSSEGRIKYIPSRPTIVTFTLQSTPTAPLEYPTPSISRPDYADINTNSTNIDVGIIAYPEPKPSIPGPTTALPTEQISTTHTISPTEQVSTTHTISPTEQVSTTHTISPTEINSAYQTIYVSSNSSLLRDLPVPTPHLTNSDYYSWNDIVFGKLFSFPFME